MGLKGLGRLRARDRGCGRRHADHDPERPRTPSSPQLKDKGRGVGQAKTMLCFVYSAATLGNTASLTCSAVRAGAQQVTKRMA